MKFEICVDSVEGVLAAQQAGADRVELCDNLVEGGTTPSIGAIRLARRMARLGLHVIIRPRGGDFVYSDVEFEVMRQDIQAAKEAGADGVVIGLLLPDGRVDEERTRQLVELARPMSVTFHRAFDLSRDASEALEALIGMGINRVLTSGQKNTAPDGADCIARLVQQAAGRMIVLAGGGIEAGNVAALVRSTGLEEIHFAARKQVPSSMLFKREECFMGGTYQPDEYSLTQSDEALIADVMRAAIIH